MLKPATLISTLTPTCNMGSPISASLTMQSSTSSVSSGNSNIHHSRSSSWAHAMQCAKSLDTRAVRSTQDSIQHAEQRKNSYTQWVPSFSTHTCVCSYISSFSSIRIRSRITTVNSSWICLRRASVSLFALINHQHHTVGWSPLYILSFGFLWVAIWSLERPFSLILGLSPSCSTIWIPNHVPFPQTENSDHLACPDWVSRNVVQWAGNLHRETIIYIHAGENSEARWRKFSGQVDVHLWAMRLRFPLRDNSFPCD